MATDSGEFALLVRRFKLAVQVEGLRPKTIRGYTRDLEWFGDWLNGRPLSGVTSTDIREYLASKSDRWSPKTIRETQLILRRFFRFLVEEGQLQSDPTATIKLRRFRVRPQPSYLADDVKSLLEACDLDTDEGIRDTAIILTLYDTGVREGELVSMKGVDFDRHTTQVEGKTGFRTVPLGSATIQAIELYIHVWGVAEPPLWRSRKGNFTESGVLQMVRRIANRAGIKNRGVHAFRRTSAMTMKRLGMNDSDIMEVLGWKSVTMLKRYTASAATELAQRAHEKFSPVDNLQRPRVDQPNGSVD